MFSYRRDLRSTPSKLHCGLRLQKHGDKCLVTVLTRATINELKGGWSKKARYRNNSQMDEHCEKESDQTNHGWEGLPPPGQPTVALNTVV